MKTFKLKQKLIGTLAGIGIVVMFTLIVPSCAAQNAWKVSEVKGTSSVFKCEKNGENLFIQNSHYEDPMKNRKEYDTYADEYSYVRLVSHDSFLEAFREAFSKDKLAQLSKLNEYVIISVNVDEKGKIISIRFSLHEGTTIIPSEMEVLENELRKRVQFEVIGKRIDAPIFYRVPLRVRFTEVKNGEIRTVRNMENLKAPNTDNQ